MPAQGPPLRRVARCGSPLAWCARAARRHRAQLPLQQRPRCQLGARRAAGHRPMPPSAGWSRRCPIHPARQNVSSEGRSGPEVRCDGSPRRWMELAHSIRPQLLHGHGGHASMQAVRAVGEGLALAALPDAVDMSRCNRTIPLDKASHTLTAMPAPCARCKCSTQTPSSTQTADVTDVKRASAPARPPAHGTRPPGSAGR